MNIEAKSLNQLCIFFNGYYGYTSKGECYFNKDSIEFVKKALKTKSVELRDESSQPIKKIKRGEYTTYQFPDGYLELCGREALKFEKVIIKHDDPNYWEEIPDVWYTSSSEYYNTNSNVLPVDSRKYIKIIKDFGLVEIDSNIKGSRITLDDVLFASRCFMRDGFRCVDKYKVIRVDNTSILEIEPCIDNYD